MNTIKHYLRRTKSYRGDKDQLLLTTVKPFKQASKATVSKWVLKSLKMAGIDTTKFSSHSTRAASTSLAAKMIPLQSVMKAANWKNVSTFAKYYNKPVEDSQSFSQCVLDSVVDGPLS